MGLHGVLGGKDTWSLCQVECILGKSSEKDLISLFPSFFRKLMLLFFSERFLSFFFFFFPFWYWSLKQNQELTALLRSWYRLPVCWQVTAGGCLREKPSFPRVLSTSGMVDTFEDNWAGAEVLKIWVLLKNQRCDSGSHALMPSSALHLQRWRLWHWWAGEPFPAWAAPSTFKWKNQWKD